MPSFKPWKIKGWVIPPEQNSQFVANMERVLDIYKLPYNEDYPVVCMDESPKQLIEQLASTAIKPGQEALVDYEYIQSSEKGDIGARWRKKILGYSLIGPTIFQIIDDGPTYIFE